MTLMVCKKKRSEIEKKTKWWKLKKEECCEEFRQKLRQALGGQVVLPDDWETTAEVIRETGRKVLGVSSGRRKEDKETWWWNEEVQDSIQRKRLAKKKWDMDRTEENRQEYKELQRRVKREVSKAKQKAYDELYTRLDTREGEKDLYRLARQRDRDGKDVQQVRVIKDRDGRVLTSEESVQRRWKEYFEELMNEENEREKRVEGVNSVEQKVDKIRKDEVRKALKRMKSGKAVGPDDILVEVWKCLGEAAVEFLASLFNRVLENLEKAYDRVPREELWYCMRKSGVAEKYVRVVQDMYERSRTVVRCAVGQTEEFNVEVGLHQGSALSPFLFAIVMDQLSEEVRQESPWTMMFADDIVICSESREQVEKNLERWRFALERRGMKVSRSKTEYMCVNEREGSGTVRLQGEEVKKVQEFKYLGSTVQSSGECGKEVKKRVQAGWNGWRKVSGVLCEQKISARIKGKVYRTVVRVAMLYGLETVSLRKRQESELEVAELKMLRFSLGVTRLDRIRNEYIRGTAHVGCLGDKVREDRLRWFGHVQRRESEYIGVSYIFIYSYSFFIIISFVIIVIIITIIIVVVNIVAIIVLVFIIVFIIIFVIIIFLINIFVIIVCVLIFVFIIIIIFVIIIVFDTVYAIIVIITVIFVIIIIVTIIFIITFIFVIIIITIIPIIIIAFIIVVIFVIVLIFAIIIFIIIIFVIIVLVIIIVLSSSSPSSSSSLLSIIIVMFIILITIFFAIINFFIIIIIIIIFVILIIFIFLNHHHQNHSMWYFCTYHSSPAIVDAPTWTG
ncbi:hypothetical protein QTP70_001294 [Hemibagrus guttatus]|uniref:ribonuclease H n=1 Tax=Hemibagrus guttatus TaxID=175788 RepID=A0AAE0Q5A9_9TELE|nr:hypothetical protein QTP70_001294 [Hemibagrus guttatus]